MNIEKGSGRVEPERDNALVRWILAFVHPVEPFGDYFIQLRNSVAASAPVECPSCA